MNGWQRWIVAVLLIAFGAWLEGVRADWMDEPPTEASATISPPSKYRVLRKAYHNCHTLTRELRQTNYSTNWRWR